MDMEKVINGLNDIGGFIAGRVGFAQARNFLRTIDDAIELFKEQEAAYQGAEELLRQKTILFDDAIKRLKEQETEWEKIWEAPDGTYKGRCKRCGFVHIFIEYHDSQYNFCPSCGRSVKWE